MEGVFYQDNLGNIHNIFRLSPMPLFLRCWYILIPYSLFLLASQFKIAWEVPWPFSLIQWKTCKTALKYKYISSMWQKINNLIGFRLFLDTLSTPPIFLVLQAKFIGKRIIQILGSRINKILFYTVSGFMEKISYLVLSPRLVCTSVLLFVQMIVTLSLEWLGVALFLFFWIIVLLLFFTVHFLN